MSPRTYRASCLINHHYVSTVVQSNDASNHYGQCFLHVSYRTCSYIQQDHWPHRCSQQMQRNGVSLLSRKFKYSRNISNSSLIAAVFSIYISLLVYMPQVDNNRSLIQRIYTLCGNSSLTRI